MVVNSMSYATYERYKDSGVDWLGEIPSDWELISLNRVSKVKSISNHPNERLLSVYLEPVHNLFNNKAMKARLVN